MNISCVKAVYYSAVGSTEKVVTGIAEKIAAVLGVPVETYDFTLPENRTEPKVFAADQLVVFGTPVYAGRVPNVILKDLAGNKTEVKYDVNWIDKETPKIIGVENLKEVTYRIMPDRIEAGTFLIAGAITGGMIKLNKVEVSKYDEFI